MTTPNNSLLRLFYQCALGGIATSVLLNLLVMFVPMPDGATEALVALQVVGLWVEIWRATPYHMSAWPPILVNAALYGLLVFGVSIAVRQRKAAIQQRAV